MLKSITDQISSVLATHCFTQKLELQDLKIHQWRHINMHDSGKMLRYGDFIPQCYILKQLTNNFSLLSLLLDRSFFLTCGGLLVT